MKTRAYLIATLVVTTVCCTTSEDGATPPDPSAGPSTAGTGAMAPMESASAATLAPSEGSTVIASPDSTAAAAGLPPRPAVSMAVTLPARYTVSGTNCTHWGGTFDVTGEPIPPEDSMDGETVFLRFTPVDAGSLSNGAVAGATADFQFDMAATFMAQDGRPGIFSCDGVFSGSIIHMQCEPLGGAPCVVVMDRVE